MVPLALILSYLAAQSMARSAAPRCYTLKDVKLHPYASSQGMSPILCSRPSPSASFPPDQSWDVVLRNADPLSVLYALITGPEVFTSRSSPNDALYRGHPSFPIRLSKPGTYFVQVEMMASDSTLGSNLLGRPASKSLNGSRLLSFHLPGPKRRDPPPSNLCPPFYTEGRWEVQAEGEGILPNFAETCRFFDGHSIKIRDKCSAHTLSRAPTAPLRFRPYNCVWRELDDPRTCQAGKHVCVVGDSTIRHVYNGLGATLGGYDDANIAADKAVLTGSSGAVRYLYMNFGELSWIANELVENCTHLLVNFGQWPASYRAEPAPWHVPRYREQVRQLSIRLRQLSSSRGIKVLWMRTLPYPSHGRLEADPGRDNRLDWVLEGLNAVAASEMRTQGIPTIDLWSIAHPLKAYSYDQKHFLAYGAVGWAINNALLHSICGDSWEVQDLAGGEGAYSSFSYFPGGGSHYFEVGRWLQRLFSAGAGNSDR